MHTFCHAATTCSGKLLSHVRAFFFAVSSLGVIIPLVLGRRFKSAFFLARTFGVSDTCKQPLPYRKAH